METHRFQLRAIEMPRLPDLEALAILAKVAETGSLSQAAKELALSKATVSKAVARLEAKLRTQLVHRTSRRLALTETGRALSIRAAQMIAEAETGEAEATEGSAAPRGRVRMSVPMSFGLQHVAPVLPDFLTAFPEVTLELYLDDRVIDLVGEGVDVAMRIAALPDSRLVARKLCDVRRLVVGAPEYLKRRGRPLHPRELMGHSCLGYTYLPTGDRWRFVGPNGEEIAVAVSGALQANNADALVPALKAGFGLAVQPEFVVWREIQAGSLQTVLEDWSPPSISLHMVTPPGAHRPAKVSALMEFLTRRFSENSAPWRKPAK